MAGYVVRLEYRFFVPGNTEPLQVLVYHFCVFIFGALFVGIFDSQKEFTGVFFRKEVIKNSGAYSSYVQRTRRTGGKSYSYFLIHNIIGFPVNFLYDLFPVIVPEFAG